MMNDEFILFEGKLPMRALYCSHRFLWFALFGWNIGLLISWLQSFGENVKITSQRVVLNRGIFSKDVEEVEYYRVKDTGCQQTLLQRIMGIGTITLYSDDATSPELSFTIGQPEYYREHIRAGINQQRQQMRALQLD